jgi:hypothetical protein
VPKSGPFKNEGIHEVVPSKYEEENTVYHYFEDGGGVWCYVPPVKNTLQ